MTISKDGKHYVSAEEAIALLPDSAEIHITYQVGMAFVGADWSREKIIDKITKSDVRELTGPYARAMNHGLVCYNNNAKFQSDLLFIETDMERLKAFDPLEDEADDNGV